MIASDEMMDILLEACPSFLPKWQSFLEEWQEEEGDLTHYLALGEMARHLVEMLERGETQTFPAVFAVVEQLHLKGDDYVQEAATVGLLEDIQNPSFYRTGNPEQFRTYLGRESERWWNKLYDFWERGIPLTDDGEV